MKYRVRDLQFAVKYFHDGGIFDSKEEILDHLADFHNIDFTCVKDNDEPYEDIYECLNEMKDFKTRLEWILDYGEWEVEEVKDYDKTKRIINDFIMYYTGSNNDIMKEVLKKYLKDGIPFD